MRTVVTQLFVCIALPLVFLACGCSDSAESDQSTKQKDKQVSKESAKSVKKKDAVYFPIDEFAPTTVVIRVNGTGITKAEYSDWYSLKDRIFRAKNKISLRTNNKKTSDFANSSRPRICPELVRRELIRQFAVSNNVVLTQKQIERAETNFTRLLGAKNKDFTSIQDEFGPPFGELLKAAVLAEELDRACVAASTTNNLKSVSKEEAEAQLKLIKETNARAAKKNAEQRELALRAREDIFAKVKEGVQFADAFADIATNRGEVAKEEGLEWDTVELDEFEADEPLARWLIVAKEGDVSDPIDMEDGLSIIGLKRKYMGEAPAEFEPQMQHELVRCTFFAHDEYEEPETLEELSKDMLKLRRQRASAALFDRLMESARIEYPCGEKIFKPVKRKGAGKKNRKAPAAADASSSKSKEMKNTGEPK